MTIILCDNCNNPVFVPKKDISHTCPNCEFKIDVQKTIKKLIGD